MNHLTQNLLLANIAKSTLYFETEPQCTRVAYIFLPTCDAETLIKCIFISALTWKSRENIVKNQWIEL
jgi:hypothetical protein